MALVSGISLDPEAAIGVTKKLPPKWVEGIDEVKLKWEHIYVDTPVYIVNYYNIFVNKHAMNE